MKRFVSFPNVFFSCGVFEKMMNEALGGIGGNGTFPRSPALRTKISRHELFFPPHEHSCESEMGYH